MKRHHYLNNATELNVSIRDPLSDIILCCCHQREISPPKNLIRWVFCAIRTGKSLTENENYQRIIVRNNFLDQKQFPGSRFFPGDAKYNVINEL